MAVFIYFSVLNAYLQEYNQKLVNTPLQLNISTPVILELCKDQTQFGFLKPTEWVIVKSCPLQVGWWFILI